jgi:hypothetical protein
MVLGLAAIPKRLLRRDPGLPPKAKPSPFRLTVNRTVRWAEGLTTLGNRSAKVTAEQASF